MPKFTLIGEHTDLHGSSDGTKLSYEFYAEELTDVLEHVDLFIRGCGYVPAPGTLNYVADEFGVDVDDIMMDYYSHSPCYFDKDRNK